MSKNWNVSRRIFLMGATASMAGCATGQMTSLKKMGYESPNEKLNLAAIGAGGKGGGDIAATAVNDNVVALCDPDWRRAGGTFDQFPNARKFRDFRVMLEAMPEIDGVTVSTPDHTHAVASMMAMQMGKHVYCQKPLTHTIWEARQMTEAARKYGVATQMGNQGHSGEGVRRSCEMIWDGAIGPIREVHCWTNRPIWPQGSELTEPLPEEEIPDFMDWDLWLGPAPYRPFNRNYAPFNWRGWWDFGTGALGDMACHIMDTAYWSLQLKYPTSVECVKKVGYNEQTYPDNSVIKFEFPARGTMPPVDVYWYDGGNLPPRPRDIPDDVVLGEGSNGSLFVGDEGYLTCHTYGENSRLLPEEKFRDYEPPAPYIPRRPDHYRDWTNACKGQEPACSNFDYSGPFTEMVLLGNFSLRFDGKIMWDGDNMRVTNIPEANEYVRLPYRDGWGWW